MLSLPLSGWGLRSGQPLLQAWEAAGVQRGEHTWGRKPVLALLSLGEKSKLCRGPFFLIIELNTCFQGFFIR